MSEDIDTRPASPAASSAQLSFAIGSEPFRRWPAGAPGMVRDIWHRSVLVRQADLAGRRFQRAGYPLAPQRIAGEPVFQSP